MLGIVAFCAVAFAMFEVAGMGWPTVLVAALLSVVIRMRPLLPIAPIPLSGKRSVAVDPPDRESELRFRVAELMPVPPLATIRVPPRVKVPLVVIGPPVVAARKPAMPSAISGIAASWPTPANRPSIA